MIQLIKNPLNNTTEVVIYLNSATEIISVKIGNDTEDVVNVDIINVYGQKAGSYELTTTNTPVNKLLAGNYILKLYNNKVNLVK